MLKNSPVTKVELNKTEKSLSSEIKNGNKLLRQEILKAEERVEDLEEGQKRIEAIVNKISVQMDGFVGKVEALEQENVIGTKHYRDHEKRISKLEVGAQSA
jgi:uncharacterized phage infection (PIP) family protein YhgE